MAFAVVATALAVAPGCVREPTIELHGVGLRDATTSGVHLALILRVNNHNSFDVKVRDVRLRVVIEDEFELPAITHNPDTWLAAGDTTLVTIPTRIPWTMVPTLLAATADRPSIRYRATGTADVTATKRLAIDKSDHPIDERGTLSRDDLVKAAKRGVFGWR